MNDNLEQIRPFTAFLQELKNGEVADEMTAELASLVSAVNTLQRRGSITLTLTLMPNKGRGLMVTESIVCKAPRMERAAALFFASNGSLVREDPRQMNLDDLYGQQNQTAEPAPEHEEEKQ